MSKRHNETELNKSQNDSQYKDAEFSFKKGMTFRFEDLQHQIVLNASAFSGKESVYIDGKLISDFRSFSRSSIHTFKINSINYELELNTISILNGKLECSLIKEGVHLKTLKLNTVQSSKTKLTFKFILANFILGAVAGYFIAYFLV